MSEYPHTGKNLLLLKQEERIAELEAQLEQKNILIGHMLVTAERKVQKLEGQLLLEEDDNETT